MKFNILREAFIENADIANPYLVSVEELDGLLACSGSVFTISGQSISLLIDLGSQRAVESLGYYLDPVTASGVSVAYGRSLDALTSGYLAIEAESVVVLPTQSGYDSPRYFKVTHVPISGIEYSIKGLAVYNSEGEVQFGEGGDLQSQTITAPANGGYSDVYAIAVVNSGSIDADMFVSLDTFNADYSDLVKLELSTTPTGNFLSTSEGLAMPDSLPWEWGLFDKCVVTDENTLKFSDSALNSYLYSVGQEYPRMDSLHQDMPDIGRGLILPNGNPGVVRVRHNTYRPVLIDVANNSAVEGSAPTLPESINTTNFQYVWDGDDRLYYLLGDTTRQIRYYQISSNTHHILTTVTFYNRAARCAAFYNGYLYIGGGRDTAGSMTDVGSQFWKVNVTTLVATRLSGFPLGNFSSSQTIDVIDGYLYFPIPAVSVDPQYIHRFNLETEMWGSVAYSAQLISSGYNAFTVNTELHELWFISWSLFPKTVYVFSTTLNQFTRTFIVECDNLSSSAQDNFFIVVPDSTILYYYDTGSLTVNRKTGMLVLNKIRLSLPIPILGSWMSPILRIEDQELYHRLLINYVKDADIELKYDDSIGVDNLQIRGSNTSPAAQNFTTDFLVLNDDEFYIRELNSGSSMNGLASRELVIDHSYISESLTPFTSAFLNFIHPLNTAGNMQYKFWWDPASDRQSGTSKYSAFYVCKFTDVQGDGVMPIRDEDTYERSEGNYLRIRFGQNTDASGNFTRLRFYNGNTTVLYPINAYSGRYYEVILNVNWDNLTYKLFFDGGLVGSGSVPGATRDNIGSQHSFEFFSIADGVTSREKFKHFTVSRVGNVADEDYGTSGIPVHLDDPLFGTNGSLPWIPVTVNSALIPQYKYIQFKLTFKANQVYEDLFRVLNLYFPKVIKLEDVPSGGSKEVYLRYNFDPSNNLVTKHLYLKAWMFTDKL